MRPAPIIEILNCFACFNLEADEREVSDLGLGRFLVVGIGSEIEWAAFADFNMAPAPPQFRGFSRLVVYNADDAIRR
jgi:hypothetical protein